VGKEVARKHMKTTVMGSLEIKKGVENTNQSSIRHLKVVATIITKVPHIKVVVVNTIVIIKGVWDQAID